jgi:double-strand break repair protein AddB
MSADGQPDLFGTAFEGPFAEPSPRVFGLPPGADVLQEVARGLARRMGGAPPEAWGRVTLWLPTRRMRRRLLDLLAEGGHGILPRVRLLSELGLDPAGAGLPPPVPSLRRRLELARLIAALLDREPDLAPRARLFDLSDSLAALMEEMQGEGVSPAVIAGLDVSDQSGHWARSLRFLQVLAPWFEEAGAPDGEARARRVAERLARAWLTEPPGDPVIVAGSTGARGATARLMEAVARLPQGAVILPGFDRHLPPEVWERLLDPLTAEDHPQSRAACFLQRLPLEPEEVRPWTAWDAPVPARARLVSLAMRPPPVTDQWLAEGPTLGPLAPACEGLTLLEAPSPRLEAEAIALRLRHAVDGDITAALVTPDRTLARRVAACLDRWGVTPDDSAGEPLALSPPGRLLRQVAELRGRAPTPEAVLALLKHPLVRAGEERGAHMAQAHALELHLRRRGPAGLAPGSLRRWAEGREGEPADRRRIAWAAWLTGVLGRLDAAPATAFRRRPLAEHLEEHVRAAETLCAPGAEGANPLWAEAAGRAAREAVERLARHAEAGGAVTARDYAHLLDGILRAEEVRRPDRGHPRVLIWGTQEAQGQGADLVILAGLNEGTWPAPAPGDPWLNRRLREKAGLPLPERRIGGAAHDFAQGLGAREVWLTRAVRTDEAPTTPSRWLNRLLNLIGGLPAQGGREALAGMRRRAEPWLRGADALAQATNREAPARRPSPRPPAHARLRRLSVTMVERLLRDPYSVYAAEVLRLRALDPLTPQPDALERGTHLHKVMERFVRDDLGPLEGPLDLQAARALLLARAEAVLADECGWPVHRRLWAAQLGRAAHALLLGEAERRARARPQLFEVRGEVAVAGVLIVGKADRIDVGPDGRVHILDYKTGEPPSLKRQKHFAKQLLIEAAMAERGAFGALGPVEVAGAAYVGLGAEARVVHAPLDEVPTGRVWDELALLLARYAEPSRGFSARIAVDSDRHEGEHDHLARFGEWGHSDAVQPEVVGEDVDGW